MKTWKKAMILILAAIIGIIFAISAADWLSGGKRTITFFDAIEEEKHDF